MINEQCPRCASYNITTGKDGDIIRWICFNCEYEQEFSAEVKN